jgi:hypothetical protein
MSSALLFDSTHSDHVGLVRNPRDHCGGTPADPVAVAGRDPASALSLPPKCYGPMPIAVTKRHPMVHCEHVVDDAGIRVWRCPVCFRFVLEWL